MDQPQIIFEKTDQIDQYGDFAYEFVEKIFGRPPRFISDSTSLWDFRLRLSKQAVVSKIKEVYSVDVAHIKSGNLVEVLDRVVNAP